MDNVEVIPVIDDKLVPHRGLIEDALSVISLKNLSDDNDPDRVVKRNSYRNLHRPDISHLDWVSHSSSKENVRHFAITTASAIESSVDYKTDRFYGLPWPDCLLVFLFCFRLSVLR